VHFDGHHELVRAGFDTTVGSKRDPERLQPHRDARGLPRLTFSSSATSPAEVPGLRVAAHSQAEIDLATEIVDCATSVFTCAYFAAPRYCRTAEVRSHRVLQHRRRAALTRRFPSGHDGQTSHAQIASPIPGPTPANVTLKVTLAKFTCRTRR